ncbi:MAG: hypothetical protein V1816_00795 [Pseudomonadota bacterium]
MTNNDTLSLVSIEEFSKHALQIEKRIATLESYWRVIVPIVIFAFFGGAGGIFYLNKEYKLLDSKIEAIEDRLENIGREIDQLASKAVLNNLEKETAKFVKSSDTIYLKTKTKNKYFTADNGDGRRINYDNGNKSVPVVRVSDERGVFCPDGDEAFVIEK